MITDPESAYINQREYRMQKSYTIDTPDLETSLVNVLTIRMGKRRNVRNLLNGFGVRQWCALSTFLAKLHITRLTDDVYQLSLA